MQIVEPSVTIAHRNHKHRYVTRARPRVVTLRKGKGMAAMNGQNRNRFRIQVDDELGSAALIIDPDELPARKQARLTELAQKALDELASLPGVASREHARHILLAALTRAHSDELAYERIAASRGLLPL